MYNNFEISLVVFMPNITTNNAITYTNSAFVIVIKAIRSVVVYNLFCASKWTFLESLTVWKYILILRMFYQRSSKFCSLVNAFSSKTKTEKRNTHKTVIFMVRKKKLCQSKLDISFFLPFFISHYIRHVHKCTSVGELRSWYIIIRLKSINHLCTVSKAVRAFKRITLFQTN